MANTMEITGAPPAIRPWRAVRAGTVAAARPAEVILTRNAVMHEALGGRTWFGALAIAADGAFADVTVRIRFHDREGRPVGTPLSARAARLAPGAVLHLQARLPAGATGLRVHALRRTRGGRTVELGRAAPLAFGVVQH